MGRKSSVKSVAYERKNNFNELKLLIKCREKMHFNEAVASAVERFVMTPLEGSGFYFAVLSNRHLNIIFTFSSDVSPDCTIWGSQGKR